MIYTEDLYLLFLDQIRADQRGLSVEVDEFNRALRLVNHEIFVEYTRNFESDLENSDTLGYFKVHNYAISLSTVGGTLVGNLPANYYQMIGRPRVTVSGATKRLDILTTYEDAEREDDYLTMATTEHPTCTIGGVDSNGNVQIRVRPSGLTTVYIDYLRGFTQGGTPPIPFLDYYTNDTTLVKTYLDETTTLQSVPVGYTYRDGTVGGAAVTVTSLTKNLVWDDGDLPILIAKLVKYTGIQLPDEGLYQAGTIEEAKSKEA